MSLDQSNDEGSKEDDILWNLVKYNQFLKYEHSIEQIKPSRFEIPAHSKRSGDDTNCSNFGRKVIKDFLHIGLVSEKSTDGQVKRSRILLLVWPSFVFPGSYQTDKLYLGDVKRIKTMVFRVPDQVFRKYSHGNNSSYEIVAATAILTPVDEWKLLERDVISSFYHLAFDKATSDLHGDIHAWQNYQVENLNKGWKQLLFICCGPQGFAYLVKRMLKRNWAGITRNSVSIDAESDGYSVFCTGGVIKLLVEWAKLYSKPDGVVKFLEEINVIKPILSSGEITDKANVSFVKFKSTSKKYQCTMCSYQADYESFLTLHARTHTGETPFVCELCGSAYIQCHLLKEHKIRSHTGDYPYSCKYCGRPFINNADNKFHVSIHERKGNVQFQCYKCSYEAKDEGSLMQHMPKHKDDPTFDCTVCRNKCDSETALLAHSRNHSKNKPFKCHICGKGFLVENSLRRHYMTHSDSRPVFTCQVCNKNFATIYSIRSHMVSQHGEEFKA